MTLLRAAPPSSFPPDAQAQTWLPFPRSLTSDREAFLVPSVWIPKSLSEDSSGGCQGVGGTGTCEKKPGELGNFSSLYFYLRRGVAPL